MERLCDMVGPPVQAGPPVLRVCGAVEINVADYLEWFHFDAIG